jgi:hypothetical protein
VITAVAHVGATVVVEAAEADCLWLAEFLGPAFTEVGVDAALASGAPRVRMDTGLAPRGGDGRAGRRVAFAFDAGPITLPEVAVAGGTRFHDPVLDVAFDVADDGFETTVRFDESRRREARLALMRVVREYVHNHAVGTGRVILHAAAVATRQGAVAVAGVKNVGKTTLALQLLSAAPDVGYLSNDRLLLAPGEELAHGIPTVVAVRAGTRQLLPALTSRLESAGDFRASAAERAAGWPAPPASRRDVWYFSPSQVCDALDRPAHAAGPLVSVVFVGVGGSSLSVRRLARDEAISALRAAVLGDGSGTYASDLFTTSAGPRPGAHQIEERCEHLASQVACFAVSGTRAMPPADAGRILELCLP